MKDRSRRRAKGVDDGLRLFGNHRRVWDWNVRWDREPGEAEPTLVEMAEKWQDFLPGHVGTPIGPDTDLVADDFKDLGEWYVSDTSLTGTESIDHYVVSQEWKSVEIANPLRVPFRWTGCESVVIETPAYVDADGKLLVTKAGELILGITRKQKTWRLTGERNVPAFPRWMEKYGASVNSDTVRIGSIPVPPNHLQLQRLSLGDEDRSTKIAGRSIIFRRMQLEVWWNPASWTLEVLNAGFYELQTEKQIRTEKVSKVAFPVRCTNDGKDTQRPVLLDANGKRPRDKDGNIKTLLEPKDVVVLYFNLDERLPYLPLVR